MKTAVSLPDALFQAADRLAKRLRISRSQVFQRAVSAYLKVHEEAHVTETLNEIYRREPDDIGLDPIIEKMQAATLIREKW